MRSAQIDLSSSFQVLVAHFVEPDGERGAGCISIAQVFSVISRLFGLFEAFNSSFRRLTDGTSSQQCMEIFKWLGQDHTTELMLLGNSAKF